MNMWQWGEVLDVIKASLILIGNAAHYITQSRRKSIIDSTKKSRPKLAKFLQDIRKRDLGDTGEDIFGPEARKKIVERDNTIEAFNKALIKVDPPSKKQNQQQGKGRFLARGSVGSYGGGPSRIATPYRKKDFNKPGRGSKYTQSKQPWSGNPKKSQ